ncbi:hypothetical protein ABT234_24940 [Streptomyces sp. NPDC001586]|uniref:hypothetical protein n=1 Tax=Streptomyces sp. NPDC001586 TaxID=3154387 RepID=UPI0033349670
MGFPPLLEQLVDPLTRAARLGTRHFEQFRGGRRGGGVPAATVAGPQIRWHDGLPATRLHR